MIFENMTAVPTCKSHELKRLPGRDVVSVGERVQAEVQVRVGNKASQSSGESPWVHILHDRKVSQIFVKL